MVYLVRHNTLGSLYALKVLSLTSKSLRTRLILEGQVQAKLRHVNVVAVTDVFELHGAPALIMEYVDGPSLADWLQENKPDLETAEAIFLGILDAVQTAHDMGIIHRDLKPANVLLEWTDEGPRPKVTDFGLAKVLRDDAANQHTRTGHTMGTPSYMAPEQIRDSKAVDHQADIFSLGCILYEIVFGQKAFSGNGSFEIMNSVITGLYSFPGKSDADIPARIIETIKACLEVEPEKRAHDCRELRSLFLGEAPPHAQSPRITLPPLGADRGHIGTTENHSRDLKQDPDRPTLLPGTMMAPSSFNASGKLPSDGGVISTSQAGPTTGSRPASLSGDESSNTWAWRPEQPDSPHPESFSRAAGSAPPTSSSSRHEDYSGSTGTSSVVSSVSHDRNTQSLVALSHPTVSAPGRSMEGEPAVSGHAPSIAPATSSRGSAETQHSPPRRLRWILAAAGLCIAVVALFYHRFPSLSGSDQAPSVSESSSTVRTGAGDPLPSRSANRQPPVDPGMPRDAAVIQLGQHGEQTTSPPSREADGSTGGDNAAGDNAAGPSTREENQQDPPRQVEETTLGNAAPERSSPEEPRPYAANNGNGSPRSSSHPSGEPETEEATGAVVVRGNILGARLVGQDGREWSPGTLPAGVYDLAVAFPGGITISRKELVSVKAGQTSVVQCDARAQNCR